MQSPDIPLPSPQTATDLAKAAQEIGFSYVAFGLYSVFAIALFGLAVWLMRRFDTRATEDRSMFREELKHQRDTFTSEISKTREAFTTAIDRITRENEEFHDEVGERLTRVEDGVRNVQTILEKS
jgi:nitrate reductase NapE component